MQPAAIRQSVTFSYAVHSLPLLALDSPICDHLRKGSTYYRVIASITSRQGLRDAMHFRIIRLAPPMILIGVENPSDGMTNQD